MLPALPISSALSVHQVGLQASAWALTPIFSLPEEAVLETRILLSVVIPAFQEGQVLGGTLSAVLAVLETISPQVEILVVDDGSTDATFAQIRRAHQGDSRIKGLRLSRRFGKEAALLAGLQHAQGEAVITLDADLQHPPAMIPELYRAWQAGASVVHGSKVGASPKNWLHGQLSRLFNTLFSRLSGFDLHGGSDFKLLDRRVVNILVEQLPERTRFFRGLCCWVGFQQASVPFTVPKRLSGGSRWGYGRLVAYALGVLIAFSRRPLLALPLLATVCLAAAPLLAWWGPESRFLGAIVLLGSGSILLGLAVIGQYLANIYQELQRRPPFLLAETVGIEGKPPPAGWGADEATTRDQVA
ncbi:MAG: glycosyltransferase family 2 protein [Magnetococcus sp. XQGC-1]